jgi:hypothetical protein
MKRVLLGGLLALGVVGSACACSCRVANLSQFVAEADDIYFAQLQEAKLVAGDYPDRWPRIEGKFKVGQILKGVPQPDTVTLATGTGGGDCGMSMLVPSTYVIFKRRQEGSIDACSGSSAVGAFQVDEITQKIRALASKKPVPARTK